MVFSLDDILAGIMALVAFTVGGGISRALDGIQLWADWHPTINGKPSPFVKSWAAFLIVALVLLVLVSAYQLLPKVFAELSPDMQSIVILFAGVLGAFIKNQNSQNARLKAALNGGNAAEPRPGAA